jgi:hypothetical protein
MEEEGKVSYWVICKGTHTTTNIEPGSFTLLDPEFSMADFLSRPEVAALEELLMPMIGSNA